MLEWWLRGFGDAVKVIEPETLRKGFVSSADNLSGGFYNVAKEAKK